MCLCGILLMNSYKAIVSMAMEIIAVTIAQRRASKFWAAVVDQSRLHPG